MAIHAGLSEHPAPQSSAGVGTTQTGVGLAGLGTVGGGVYQLIQRSPHLVVQRIAVRNLDKARQTCRPEDTDKLTQDWTSLIGDPDIALVVELMGGMDEAYQLIKGALSSGQHVVTANKMVIAHHGPELFALANDKGVNLLFEGAVAGGIPIVLPLKASLVGNHILQIAGILNGTTNFMLTRMEQEAGLSYESALKEAQDLGFAEADPTADVEGHDAACKLAILATLAYNQPFSPKDIYTQGISKLTAKDMAMAETLGYRIRLIALAKPSLNDTFELRVHPMLVPAEHPLAKVTFEHNAIWVQGDAVGDVMFYGKGAGQLPTASAVYGDIHLIAQALHPTPHQHPGLKLQFENPTPPTVVGIEATTNAYYVRLEVKDEPGVIGMLGQACGEFGVSLDALLQKGTHPQTQSATIVLLTHRVQESSLNQALAKMKAHPSLRQVESIIRVFEP